MYVQFIWLTWFGGLSPGPSGLMIAQQAFLLHVPLLEASYLGNSETS